MFRFRVRLGWRSEISRREPPPMGAPNTAERRALLDMCLEIRTQVVVFRTQVVVFRTQAVVFKTQLVVFDCVCLVFTCVYLVFSCVQLVFGLLL